MFEAMKAFVVANQVALAVMMALVFLAGLMSKASSRLWLRDLWVRFPVFGDLASLSKDRTQGSHGWMRAEEKLCAIYKPYVNILTRKQFNERVEYLRKCGDLGKTPMPTWMYPILFVLVVAEGLGFSYLLGTWMAREGSANTHTLMMFAIVLVIAVIMSILTHNAGHQLRRTLLLRACFNRFKSVKGDSYSSKSVSLNSPQNIDDHEPDYVQIVNRVAENSDDRGSYSVVITAVVAMVLIATISTVMRWKNLENELTQETIAAQQASAQSTPTVDAGDGISLALPEDIAGPQRAADSKAQQESINNTQVEGASAFIMLGVIFFLTQLVGIGAGYKYSFVGRETYKKVKDTWFMHDGAYADTSGISTYETYKKVHEEPLSDLANSRLKDLQHRLEMLSSKKLDLNKTFRDYLVVQKNQADEADEEINRPREVAKPAHSTAPAAATAPEQLQEGYSQTDQAKAAILAMTDKEMQKSFYTSLPEAVREELKPWLKQRKEVEEAAAAAAAAAVLAEAAKKDVAAEADDLF